LKKLVVEILTGRFEDKPVQGVTFDLIKDFQPHKKGGGFFLVDGRSASEGEYPARPIRIKVTGTEGGVVTEIEGENASPSIPKTRRHETEEETIERIRERFDILEQMTQATQDGTVRALVVSGPPGVGKSFGVETTLEKFNVFDKIAAERPKYEVVRGSMTAIGLYQKLFKFSDKGNILVLDDCDSVLFDDVSLNILKAALDSSKHRYISWNAESRILANEGVPDRFEFKGSMILITNIKFDYVKSKKLQDHLAAIMSRCHYLDLTLDTVHDRWMRCKQIINDGMLTPYNFTPEEESTLLGFIEGNKDKLNEVSLRMINKIADLVKMSPDWEKIARATCMKRSAAPGYAGKKS
tara:strand:- start:375 stop:1433 length:1059 start_codon:yes stop_codon:yes gene_type:complete